MPSFSPAFLHPESNSLPRALHHTNALSPSASSSSSSYDFSCSTAGSSCPSLASSRTTPETSRGASSAGSSEGSSCCSCSLQTELQLDDGKEEAEALENDGHGTSRSCPLHFGKQDGLARDGGDGELCIHMRRRAMQGNGLQPSSSTAILRHVDSMLLRRPSLKARDEKSPIPSPPPLDDLSCRGSSIDTTLKLATVRLNPVSLEDFISPILPLPSPALRFRLPGDIGEAESFPLHIGQDTDEKRREGTGSPEVSLLVELDSLQLSAAADVDLVETVVFP